MVLTRILLTQGLDNEAIARNQLKNALSKSYDDLKKAHLADYHKYFNRVKLDLGNICSQPAHR